MTGGEDVLGAQRPDGIGRDCTVAQTDDEHRCVIVHFGQQLGQQTGQHLDRVRKCLGFSSGERRERHSAV